MWSIDVIRFSGLRVSWILIMIGAVVSQDVDCFSEENGIPDRAKNGTSGVHKEATNLQASVFIELASHSTKAALKGSFGATRELWRKKTWN